MACILHIETAGELCSVAVSQDGGTIYDESANSDEGGSEKKKSVSGNAGVLGSLVEGAMSFTDNHAIPFDAVAVSSGPGSYTGLRIGVSMAKGICYGRNLKLIAVPTLKILTVPFLLRHDDIEEDALICPMIDARRMEVYTALYTRALKPVVDVCAKVIDEHSFEEQLNEHPVYFMGSGAEKCMQVIKHKNAHFINNVRLHAKNMAPLAEQLFLRGEFEDVAYFEPNYLKEWTTTHKDQN
ncbi:MAG: tRNA (adenosine(37)-N6)-threonylcarbamoyltransferase complex dimerization subunit type 1 TsaB [Bacteroidaceae bacterium]|nr:tRNA (adenosine(37)-N6)-threonylcarbamoyltransferase complex dimerization subunit type 1 TsaB [Bacteroidaceae bacterium]